MSRGDIYKITAADNINTKEWLAKKLENNKQQKLEQQVDDWLLHWNKILGEDKKLEKERQNDLFKSKESELVTIDQDRGRGLILKDADQNKNGNLEVHEYNKAKKNIAGEFVNSQLEQKNPLIQEFVKSKSNYYKEFAVLWHQEEKLLLNEVEDQLEHVQNNIVSWNADKWIASWNARNTIVAGNSVNVISSNGLTPEKFAVDDPFDYASEYQKEWNRTHASMA